MAYDVRRLPCPECGKDIKLDMDDATGTGAAECVNLHDDCPDEHAAAMDEAAWLAFCERALREAEPVADDDDGDWIDEHDDDDY